MAEKKHVALKATEGGKRFLRCRCGGWQSDPALAFAEQRQAHREHRKEMGEPVRVDWRARALKAESTIEHLRGEGDHHKERLRVLGAELRAVQERFAMERTAYQEESRELRHKIRALAEKDRETTADRDRYRQLWTNQAHAVEAPKRRFSFWKRS